MMLTKFYLRNMPRMKYAYSSWTNISVPDFYKETSILVTGSTGFLGQGLIEKLLRSCPDIGNIYVPIRPNKHGNTRQRYEKLLRYPVFDELRKINPKFGEKIIPLDGDITRENIGLKDHVVDRLTEEVSAIFHCAADIKLNPPLRESVQVNVVGSKNVYNFGNKCQNLCVYVHVSTTFANMDEDFNEEKIYPASRTPIEITDLVRCSSDTFLKRNEKRIVAPFPVVYVYCKKIAENVITEEWSNTPVAVFRSCFISPAISEPFFGWYHGHAGYCGVMHEVKRGKIRHLAGDPKHPIEILPVDLIVNSLISVGWYLGARRHTGKDPLVLNVHSSAENPFTLRELEMVVNENREAHGGIISLKILPNRLLSYLNVASYNLLPLMYKDLVAVLRGRRPVNLATFVRLRKGIGIIEISNFRTYTKEFKNAKKIHDLLCDTDKKVFPFDVKGINWKKYIRQWIDIL